MTLRMNHRRPPGRLRYALCEALESLLPEFTFNPWDVWLQNPQYSTMKSDGCSWGAEGKHRNPDSQMTISVSLWSTMAQCVRNGVVLLKQDHPWSAEVTHGEVRPKGERKAKGAK